MRLEDYYLQVEKINLPEDALVKLYGFPLAAPAALLIGEQDNQILTYPSNFAPYINSFIERGKFRQDRDEIEARHQGTFVALVNWDRRFVAETLIKQGMFCRLLDFRYNLVHICVPKDMKETIFLEEDKSRYKTIRFF